VSAWRSPYWLDVVEFEQLAARAETAHKATDVRCSLEAAAGLYAGDFLPDCYDDWVVAERERLCGGFLAVVERLAELFELERDYRGAIRWARRLLDHDEVNEAACERLMRLYALSGDRARALRVYHGCATALVRELGVAPSAAIREAYERLIEPEAARVPQERGTAVPVRSPLVGRREEWDALRGAWRRAVEGQALLVVIAGEAGIGKSRLGEELRDWVGRQGFTMAGSRCYSAAGSLAYAPVIELLRSQAIGPGLRRLGDAWLAELERLLPELRDERPDLPLPPPLSDDWRRARLFDALAKAILAEERPLLLVIDDLQYGSSVGYQVARVVAPTRSHRGPRPAGRLVFRADGAYDPPVRPRVDRARDARLQGAHAGPDRAAHTPGVHARATWSPASPTT